MLSKLQKHHLPATQAASGLLVLAYDVAKYRIHPDRITSKIKNMIDIKRPTDWYRAFYIAIRAAFDSIDVDIVDWSTELDVRRLRLAAAFADCEFVDAGVPFFVGAWVAVVAVDLEADFVVLRLDRGQDAVNG